MTTSDASPGGRLLPCPFCGKAPRLHSYVDEDGNPDSYQVSCDNHPSGCIIVMASLSRDTAIDRWNRRALGGDRRE